MPLLCPQKPTRPHALAPRHDLSRGDTRSARGRRKAKPQRWAAASNRAGWQDRPFEKLMSVRAGEDTCPALARSKISRKPREGLRQKVIAFRRSDLPPGAPSYVATASSGLPVVARLVERCRKNEQRGVLPTLSARAATPSHDDSGPTTRSLMLCASRLAGHRAAPFRRSPPCPITRTASGFCTAFLLKGLPATQVPDVAPWASPARRRSLCR